jgi:transposase
MVSVRNIHDNGIYVGLDYAQSGVQTCVLGADGNVLLNRLLPNDAGGIRARVAAFGEIRNAAIEACGGAADLAEELVERHGWSVQMAHPGFVRRMAQNPDKSDFTDARLLADLVRVGYLPRVWLAPEKIRELRRLTRHRQQLVNTRRAVRQRIGAILREQRIAQPKLTRWYGPWLKWLREEAPLSEQGRWVIERQLAHGDFISREIDQVMARLSALTEHDAMTQRLLEMRGIGRVTAFTLRAEIGRFDRFRTGKQLGRFCGLSPRNASSGDRQADAGLIRAASGQLRATIIEAAHCLARYEPRWSAMRQRMKDAGKPGSVIAAAIGNRWLRWLFHEMKPYGLAMDP